MKTPVLRRNGTRPSTLAQRVEVCKLIDSNKNGSRKLKVKVALVAAGLKSPGDRGPEASVKVAKKMALRRVATSISCQYSASWRPSSVSFD